MTINSVIIATVALALVASPAGAGIKKQGSATATPPPPARTTPKPPAERIGDQYRKLLDRAVTSYAPLAARAAKCGYWDGNTWYYKFMMVEMRIAGDDANAHNTPIADKFVDLYNNALRENALSGTSCSFIYNLALDALVQIDQIKR